MFDPPLASTRHPHSQPATSAASPSPAFRAGAAAFAGSVSRAPMLDAGFMHAHSGTPNMLQAMADWLCGWDAANRAMPRPDPFDLDAASRHYLCIDDGEGLDLLQVYDTREAAEAARNRAADRRPGYSFPILGAAEAMQRGVAA